LVKIHLKIYKTYKNSVLAFSFKMQVPSPSSYSRVVRLYLQWSQSVSNVYGLVLQYVS